jgi:hypothetical protein
MDEWELEILRKIDNKEKLDESELSDLVFEYGIKDEKSEHMKWSRSATTIVELGDRYFKIYWNNDLSTTEDNYYYKQPTEVELKEYSKTITVKEWVNKC